MMGFVYSFVIQTESEVDGLVFAQVVFGMNDDLWDRVRGLGSETWKGCE